MRPALALVAVLVAAGCLAADAERPLAVGTTTSVHDPGFADHLLARFASETGRRAIAVVAGSGEVLEKARRGDLDVVLVHHPEAEAAFVASGAGRARTPVFENRFLLVGPKDDPAGIANATSAADAFARIAAAEARFASRGDGSGTHAREVALWRASGVDATRLAGPWRFETGSGQAATLLVANERGAYALADEATWAVLEARGRLPRLAEHPVEDGALANVYAVVTVAHPRADVAAADRFASWLAGPGGRAAVEAFAVEGRAVFRPVGALP
ncbi:MAG TPA: substrate-binding domain-containing protein [Candidatus Thermoplasmatota archaeon]|nr:substrate-binding domain-containing protein [Candidatus Thermoplasmatota archaeon]